MKPLRLFLARSWPWRLLVLEALAWLVLAVPALRLLPFRWLAPGLGPANAAGSDTPLADPDDAQQRQARLIGAAVVRAARVLPGDIRCLPRAMAAQRMLARRGIAARLHLGAMPDDGGKGVAAHAWVTVGTMTVIGGADRSGFAELVRFG